jgi:Arc/MetJ-type ribon-helix-helix transcriptional regulator
MTTATIAATVKFPAADLAKIRGRDKNQSRFIREAVREKLEREALTPRQKMAAHIRRYAGRWDGDISGAELLKLTRP